MRWFGPRSWGAPVCEEPEQRIPIPVGELCAHCDEPIAETDEGVSWPHLGAEGGWTLHPRHIACAERSVLGGANHILGRCTCCGGTEPPDPPELTKREAALLAVQLAGGRRHPAEAG